MHILKALGCGDRQFFAILMAVGYRSSHYLSAPGKEFAFFALRIRFDKHHTLCLFIINGYMEMVPEGEKIALFHVLQVMSTHSTLSAAHAEALDGLEQNDRRFSLVVCCCMECLVDLSGVMAST